MITIVQDPPSAHQEALFGSEWASLMSVAEAMAAANLPMPQLDTHRYILWSEDGHQIEPRDIDFSGFEGSFLKKAGLFSAPTIELPKISFSVPSAPVLPKIYFLKEPYEATRDPAPFGCAGCWVIFLASYYPAGRHVNCPACQRSSIVADLQFPHFLAATI